MKTFTLEAVILTSSFFTCLTDKPTISNSSLWRYLTLSWGQLYKSCINGSTNSPHVISPEPASVRETVD